MKHYGANYPSLDAPRGAHLHDSAFGRMGSLIVVEHRSPRYLGRMKIGCSTIIASNTRVL
jgi:hypothetical protein